MKRLRILAWSLSVGILFSSLAVASDTDQKELAEIAGDLAVLHLGVATYHRDMGQFDPKNAISRFRKWQATVEPETIWSLTQDADPKIRTLALMAAFDLRDAQALPRFVPFLSDQAETFPEDLNRRSSMILSPDLPDYQADLSSQSVSTFARAMLSKYLEAASIHDGVTAESFAEYWADRKDRDYCLSWFLADLNWASRGSTARPEDSNRAIREVRKSIDEKVADPVERSWILLALTATHGMHYGSEILASETDRITALETLGRDRLSELFSGSIEWDDPDVILTEDNRRTFPYGAVVNFALQHTPAIFSATDFDKMLSWKAEHQRRYDNREFPYFPSVRWTIAAADLRPEKARELLMAGLDEIPYDPKSSSVQDQRTYLAMALWRHEGKAALKEVVDWFYGETPDPTAFGFGQHRFCKWMGSEQHNRLIAAIFQDERLATLHFSSLGYLVRAANEASDEEIISGEELRQAETDFGRSLSMGGPAAPELLPDDWEKRKAATLRDWAGRFR